MKTAVLIMLALFVYSGLAFGADYTKGSWRDTDRDGVKDTYVNGYYKTSPNNTKSDNYSTQGNTNPFTGKEGTVNPNSDHNSNSYNNNYNSGYGNSGGRSKKSW